MCSAPATIPFMKSEWLKARRDALIDSLLARLIPATLLGVFVVAARATPAVTAAVVVMAGSVATYAVIRTKKSFRIALSATTASRSCPYRAGCAAWD